MRKILLATGLLCLVELLIMTPAFAQNLSIRGLLRDALTHDPIPGANVVIKNTTNGTATAPNGKFTLNNLKPGNYTLVFTYIGYKTQTKNVDLNKNNHPYVIVDLSSSSVQLNGIQVTALSPDMKGTARMKQQQVREANPTDVGGLLRQLSGINAVRRGPLGLDPVVRGLRETEVGVYLNGSRIFPGGPARMDSPLSHLDPSNITDIKVVKGPYALTWGAGNMSAIWVKTKPLTNLANNSVHAHMTSGFQSNSDEISEIAGVTGKQGGIGYQIHGVLRKGQDYTSGGSGEVIPANFLSREIRGKFGVPVQTNGTITASVGFQNQEHINYPGRLLNADHFDVWNTGLKYDYEPGGQTLQSVTAQVYVNHIAHLMNNNGKPTAQPNPKRMPPFALTVDIPAHSTVAGGRASAELLLGSNWNIEVGGDSYTAYKKATRTVTRKDNGKLLFYDLVWPNAVLTDAGAFVRLKRNIGERLNFTGTVRYDYTHANADTASSFFRNNVSDQLKSTNGMLNGAATLNYMIDSAWSLGLSYGSVARTPSITERYSDRIPASKSQTSAEFVGNPSLKPERNNQADLYINADYNYVSWSFDGFIRSMDNYITINPTSLPKRLPLSPPTVYQYANGHAVFHGFESSLTVRPVDPLQLRANVSYLWGTNRSLQEPALGVSPFQLDTGARYSFQNIPLYLDGLVHIVGKQDYVANKLGETPTNGHVTADLRAGFKLWNDVMVETGVTNIGNTYYVDHLNSKNPFTGNQIPEPGRTFYINVSLSL